MRSRDFFPSLDIGVPALDLFLKADDTDENGGRVFLSDAILQCVVLDTAFVLEDAKRVSIKHKHAAPTVDSGRIPQVPLPAFLEQALAPRRTPGRLQKSR